MKTPSLAGRLAWLTTLVGGLLMLGFAGGAYAWVYRVSLQRLDRELTGTVHPQAARRHDPEHYQRFAQALDLVYGQARLGGYLLLVKDSADQVVFRSEGWPADLSSERFPAPRPDDPRLHPPPRTAPRPPRPAESPPFRPRGQPLEPPRPEGPPQPLSDPGFQTLRAGQQWRLCAMNNGHLAVWFGLPLERVNGDAERVRDGLLIALPLFLLLLLGGSRGVARRALRPLDRLAAAAERITATTLDQRLGSGGAERELQRLIAVFNAMLDRLERSFGQATRFSADAAHELKTPLTILQGHLSQALQAAEVGSELQQKLADLLAEVVRLKSITRQLLLLSLADSGQLKPELRPTDLSALVVNAADDAELLGEELTVTADIAPGVTVAADAALLGQVLTNLVSNAVKYNRPDGSIQLRLEQSEQLATVTIANTGESIPPEDHGRLFERFYRADRARGRRVDGTGLGLALAREIARAHGGELRLAESGDDRTTFVLSLPRLATEPSPSAG